MQDAAEVGAAAVAAGLCGLHSHVDAVSDVGALAAPVVGLVDLDKGDTAAVEAGQVFKRREAIRRGWRQVARQRLLRPLMGGAIVVCDGRGNAAVSRLGEPHMRTSWFSIARRQLGTDKLRRGLR